ncbi:MAG TPA: hypothetical protein VGS41_10975, partial [Chthonomonadales bacterium]|nr:hypothetical protein [Chthonomonadales bacterium]
MQCLRRFYDWRRNLLDGVTEYLRETYQVGQDWNMQRVVVVVRGGRVGRLLLERLAVVAHAEGLALVRPNIISPDQLASTLITAFHKTADRLQCVCAWAQALKQLDRETRERLFPGKEIENASPQEMFNLVEQVARLHVELAAEGYTFRQVAGEVSQPLGGFCDTARWNALAEWQDGYLRVLASSALEDSYTARQAAIDGGQCAFQGDIVLASVPELNRVAVELIEASGARVTALVLAPESEAHGFDEWGRLQSSQWTSRQLKIPEACWKVAGRPSDQIGGALQFLSSLGGKYAADQIVVGIGDAALAAQTARWLELAGVRARPAAAKTVAQTGIGCLLRAIAEYLEDPSPARSGALLRHPLITQWLTASGDVACPERLAETLDTVLGHCAPTCFPEEWPRELEEWLKAPVEDLNRAVHAVNQVLAPLRNQDLTLSTAAGCICELLIELLQGVQIQKAGDSELYESLVAIREPVQSLHSLGETPDLDMACSGSGACRIVESI